MDHLLIGLYADPTYPYLYFVRALEKYIHNQVLIKYFLSVFNIQNWFFNKLA